MAITQDKVLWQDADDLNKTNLAKAQALQMTSGYVEKGLSLSADYTNNNLSVEDGLAIVRNVDNAYLAFVKDRVDMSLENPGGLTTCILRLPRRQTTQSLCTSSKTILRRRIRILSLERLTQSQRSIQKNSIAIPMGILQTSQSKTHCLSRIGRLRRYRPRQ